MLQSFYLHGELLGSREVPEWHQEDPGGAARAGGLRYHNTALFCPECGQIWGTVQYERPAQGWSIHARNCAAHPLNTLLPDWCGSFRALGEWEPTSFKADWPLRVVEWEFYLLLNSYKEGVA